MKSKLCKVKKKKVPLSDELFDCSIVLRKLFQSIGDTDLIRTLFRIAVFDLKTEKSRLKDIRKSAISYVEDERIYFSRSKAYYTSKPMENIVVSLQPEDQIILQDIKQKLAKLTGNNKYLVDTTVIRFLIFFYGKLLMPYLNGR